MITVIVMIKLMIVIVMIAIITIMLTMTIMLMTMMMVMMVIMTLIMIMITMIKMVKIVIRKQWYFRKRFMKILYQCFSKKTYQSFSHLRTQILICLFCSLHNIAQDWCYKVIILPSCNVSKMFLGCLYYSIISGYNVTIMLWANETSVFFNQSYLKKEYT